MSCRITCRRRASRKSKQKNHRNDTEKKGPKSVSPTEDSHRLYTQDVPFDELAAKGEVAGSSKG